MSARTDLDPVEDMLAVAERLTRYTAGLDLAAVLADEMREDAVLRVLGTLGEASTRVSDATRQRFPGLPWREMRGMRNVVIHQYDAVDWRIVWNVIVSHLPDVLTQLRDMHATLLAEEPPLPELPDA